MDKGMHDLLTSQAAAVEERLRKSLGASVFDTWLKTLSVGGFKDGILTLFCRRISFAAISPGTFPKK